jgi:hypothetical protein
MFMITNKIDEKSRAKFDKHASKYLDVTLAQE